MPTTQYYPKVQENDLPLKVGDIGIVNYNADGFRECLVRIIRVYLRTDNAWLYQFEVIKAPKNRDVGDGSVYLTYKIDFYSAMSNRAVIDLLRRDGDGV